tara:strand:- start:2021 stop:2266 length:246 start_codon:yes stop_codon:yes gene_type:complete
MNWKDTIKKNKPTFRMNRGLQMEKDGKTYYSYGRNGPHGDKSSIIEGFRKDLPDHEFIVVPIAIEGRKKGTVDFVFGRKKS